MHRAILAAAVFLVGLIFSVGATVSLALDTADPGVTRIQSRSRGAKSQKRKQPRAKLKKGSRASSKTAGSRPSRSQQTRHASQRESHKSWQLRH